MTTTEFLGAEFIFLAGAGFGSLLTKWRKLLPYVYASALIEDVPRPYAPDMEAALQFIARHVRDDCANGKPISLEEGYQLLLQHFQVSRRQAYKIRRRIRWMRRFYLHQDQRRACKRGEWEIPSPKKDCAIAYDLPLERYSQPQRNTGNQNYVDGHECNSEVKKEEEGKEETV